MKSGMKELMIALVLTLTAAAALAQPTGSPEQRSWYPTVSIGLSGGGDKIVTMVYTDGTEEHVKAGELLQAGGGVQWRARELPLSLTLTANVHFAGITAKNGEANFVRYPLEAIAHYRPFDRWHFGVGMRYVLSPEATAEIDGYSDTMKFDNTHGTIVEVGVRAVGDLWINLRFVNESYRVSDSTFPGVFEGQSFDGSHVGVHATYSF